MINSHITSMQYPALVHRYRPMQQDSGVLVFFFTHRRKTFGHVWFPSLHLTVHPWAGTWARCPQHSYMPLKKRRPRHAYRWWNLHFAGHTFQYMEYAVARWRCMQYVWLTKGSGKYIYKTTKFKREKHSLPEQVVSVSMATAEEQPGLSKHSLRVLLPRLLSESQTMDVSGRSILTDVRTRWGGEEVLFAAAAEVKEE